MIGLGRPAFIVMLLSAPLCGCAEINEASIILHQLGAPPVAASEDPAATSRPSVKIRPTVEADGAPAVAVRFNANSGTYVLSPEKAEDAAWRLLEVAKLARAEIGRDDLERSI